MSNDNPLGIPADSLAAIRQVFFEECEERLTELEEGLAALEAGSAAGAGGEVDCQGIDTVFRAAHSIKGGAGIFDMKQVVRLAHLMESVLELGRQDPATLTPTRVKSLLKATDGLADAIRAARDGGELPVAQAVALEREVESLLAPVPEFDIFDLQDFEARPMDLGAFGLDAAPAGFEITFRPAAALYASANDPLLLLGELKRLGEIETVLADDGVPTLDKLDPEESYLSWTIVLSTDADEAAVREVFDFVENDCDLTIISIGGVGTEDNQAETTGEFELETDPDGPATQTPAPAVIPPAAGTAAPSIRVDLERVDRLVNLVSELVINQSMLVQQISAEALVRGSGLTTVLDDLGQLTHDIQESVMAIRAQPVRAVFQRMNRLVREVEAATGKPVRLITEGEDTEVDRTVIERLADPLTHMIRNAIDHGLESPKGRIAAGKPPEGIVRLSAAHRGGRIVLEVSDDGGGINRERVRAIAVERGIISPDAVLAPDELDSLIFAPGFSTAETVSDLSGRGVGMDVVRRSIQALGGRISVTSRVGEGSTFTLSLPLTLAVMDSMLVSVRGQSAVVPLTALVESFQVAAQDIRQLGASARLLTLRGVHVPLIDLGEALGYAPFAEADDGRAVALLVEDEHGQRAALLVDAIQDQRQVVIKSLEANYRAITGVAAATILGDGRVALILDVDAILSAERREGLAAQRPQAA